MIALLFALIAIAFAEAAIAAKLAHTIRLERDEAMLREASARIPGCDLSNAVWDRLGAEASKELEERARTGPWAGETSCYANGRFVGRARRDGWTLASAEEQEAHRALNDDPPTITITL